MLHCLCNNNLYEKTKIPAELKALGEKLKAAGNKIEPEEISKWIGKFVQKFKIDKGDLPGKILLKLKEYSIDFNAKNSQGTSLKLIW